jgi:hypothetical protein
VPVADVERVVRPFDAEPFQRHRLAVAECRLVELLHHPRPHVVVSHHVADGQLVVLREAVEVELPLAIDFRAVGDFQRVANAVAADEQERWRRIELGDRAQRRRPAEGGVVAAADVHVGRVGEPQDRAVARRGAGDRGWKRHRSDSSRQARGENVPPGDLRHGRPSFERMVFSAPSVPQRITSETRSAHRRS